MGSAGPVRVERGVVKGGVLTWTEDREGTNGRTTRGKRGSGILYFLIFPRFCVAETFLA